MRPVSRVIRFLFITIRHVLARETTFGVVGINVLGGQRINVQFQHATLVLPQVKSEQHSLAEAAMGNVVIFVQIADVSRFRLAGVAQRRKVFTTQLYAHL